MSYFWFILFLLTTIIYSCSDDSTILNNTDLIFRDSFRVKVSPYKYYDEFGTEYLVMGDTTSETGILDTLNSKPTISWNNVQLGIVSVAIFKAPIRVTGGEIANTNDIVWQWHSGMETDSLRYIKYFEGKNVYNNKIAYDSVTKELDQGTNYWWGLWGWNTEATTILFSSRPIEFFVR